MRHGSTDVRAFVAARRHVVPGPEGMVSYLRWDGPATREPILWLHPVNTAAEVWSAMAAALQPQWGSVAVDYRGHGGSDPGGSYLPQDYALDVLAVADVLGIDRFHLVGGSIGGAVSVELAALAPGRVVSIAQFGSSLRIGFSHEQTASLIGAMRELGVDEFFARHGHEVLGPSADRSAGATLVRLASGRDVETVAAIIEDAFERADSRATARALVDVPPALVAVGSHDPTCPLDQARELATALGGVTPVEMDGIGHLPMIEHPSWSVRLLRTLLTDTTGEPS